MEIEQKHFDAMISGQKCRFWNESKKSCSSKYLVGIKNYSSPFMDDDGVWWQSCEPIKTVRYLKEPVEMMKTLIEGGWKSNEYGDFEHPEKKYFNHGLWDECGKPEYEWKDTWSVDPSWIKEREE